MFHPPSPSPLGFRSSSPALPLVAAVLARRSSAAPAPSVGRASSRHRRSPASRRPPLQPTAAVALKPQPAVAGQCRPQHSRAVVIATPAQTSRCSSPTPSQSPSSSSSSSSSLHAAVVLSSWEPPVKRAKVVHSPPPADGGLDWAVHASGGSHSPQSSCSSWASSTASTSSYSSYSPSSFDRRWSMASLPVESVQPADAARCVPLPLQASAPAQGRCLLPPPGGLAALTAQLQMHPAIRRLQQLGEEEREEEERDDDSCDEDDEEEAAPGSVHGRMAMTTMEHTPDMELAGHARLQEELAAAHEQRLHHFHERSCSPQLGFTHASAPSPATEDSQSPCSLGVDSGQAVDVFLPSFSSDSSLLPAAHSSSFLPRDATPDCSFLFPSPSSSSPVAYQQLSPWCADESMWSSSERSVSADSGGDSEPAELWQDWLDLDRASGSQVELIF